MHIHFSLILWRGDTQSTLPGEIGPACACLGSHRHLADGVKQVGVLAVPHLSFARLVHGEVQLGVALLG